MSEITLPEPIAIDPETVTLTRKAWDMHVARLEDAADMRAIEVHRTRNALVGEAEARRLSYTADEAHRILDGVSHVLIWRERAELTQRALAAQAGVSVSYLAEIERGKKPGSVVVLAKLARVLNVPMEHLVTGGE